MIDAFKILFDDAMRLLSSFQINDLADIAVVTFMIYYSIKLVRETRAFQLLKGLILLLILNVLVSSLDMSASSFIFRTLFNDIALVIILLFQPEIRQVIESFGRGKIKRLAHFSFKNKDEINANLRSCAVEISKAVSNMSEKQVGALIVIEGSTLLGEIIDTGNDVDSKVTAQVLENIFFPNSPLHDGAVVIRDLRVNSAGCILPLTKNEIGKELGTRHRAAVGMSEMCDALVVVVSEETGTISCVKNGELTRGITVSELRESIIEFLKIDVSESSLLKINWRKNENAKENKD